MSLRPRGLARIIRRSSGLRLVHGEGGGGGGGVGGVGGGVRRCVFHSELMEMVSLVEIGTSISRVET